MMNKDDVDFLLEAMKSRTTTRQQHQELGTNDSEVRERPPKSPPKTSYAFDYYGNPISQQNEEAPQQLQRQVRQQYHHQDAAAASNYQVVPYQPPAWSSTQPPVTKGAKEDYSEFLVEPLATPRQPNSNGAEVYDRGCVAEFGQCIKVSLCCTPNEDDLADEVPFFEKDNDFATEGPKTTSEERAVMQEITDELAALRQSTVSAKTSRAMLEFQLRSELADVRRQKADMEESYRREIAREMSEKAILQAKLQSRLLAMMEERMRAEIQLDRLSSAVPQTSLQIGEGPSPSGGSLGNNENDMNGGGGGALIPLAANTPASQSENRSPLSFHGYLPSTPAPQPDMAPATAAAIDYGNDDQRAVSGNHSARIPIEPPIQDSIRTPVDPVSYATTTPSTSSTTPFLPTVVENANNNSGTTAKDLQYHPEGSVGSDVSFSSARNRCPPLQASE